MESSDFFLKTGKENGATLRRAYLGEGVWEAPNQRGDGSKAVTQLAPTGNKSYFQCQRKDKACSCSLRLADFSPLLRPMASQALRVSLPPKEALERGAQTDGGHGC